MIEHKSSRASSLVSVNSQSALGVDVSKHANATFTTADVQMAVEKVSERTINSNKRKMGAVVQEVSVENVQKVAAVHRTEVKRRKCALIIDDSLTIRKVFERALISLGFEVRQAENGLVGLEEMKGTVYDIVLCDFLMPIMDGVDCIQQYREWERTHRKWFHQVCLFFLIKHVVGSVDILYHFLKIILCYLGSLSSVFQHMLIVKMLNAA